ncbi:MAG: MBL fold metallo-hydrolase [Gemmatimonadetes bacterium]|nr:MBL fold metallo-hydrolase [Gemmatimonadota bacterium]
MHTALHLRGTLGAALRPVVMAVTGLGTLLGVVGCSLLRGPDAAPFAPLPRGRLERVDLCQGACTDSVDLVALGVGGWLVVPWRDTTHLVMTPPAFTNPGFVRLFFDWARLRFAPSDRRFVAERLQTLAAQGATAARLARVEAVLVGHGHYDHLMDLPSMAPSLPAAHVYGSRTVQHLLAPLAATLPAQAVDGFLADTTRAAGDRIAVGPTVTVQPLAWEHAPNLWKGPLRYTIARGDETTPRAALHRRALSWKMGAPLAWVIDVAGARGITRVLVADAAASRTVVLRAVEALGTLPAARTTVALITPASHDNAAGYPEVLLATLQPQHVVLSHWEDFFERVDDDDAARIVPAIAPQPFVERLTRFMGTRWSTLEPGATLRLRY